MASISFSRVGKVYPGGTRAVQDLNLEIEDGELMVFVGPSGCGKTTALRMVAGLEDITEGTIRVGDKIVNGIDPGERDMAMVFQNYALYPHMSIFENIAFPLRARHTSKSEVRSRVERTAALLGLTEYLKRKPRTLSGGQRQRVAMGRAIVREPQAFLMDEPLSNLDAKLRVQMRSEISNLQRDLGVTTIYVTHDQVEAMTMGTRIAIMRKGVLQQQGPPQQVYAEPANIFVAAFIGSPGMNFLQATLGRDESGFELRLPGQTLRLSDAVVSARPALAAYVDRELAMGIRPESLALGPTGGPSLRATVSRIEVLGAESLIYVTLAGQAVVSDEMIEAAVDVDATAASTLKQEAEQCQVTLIVRSEPDTDVRVGDQVNITPIQHRLHLFDLESGAAVTS
ncbi:MAG: sn-glycerol-3-phosphate ABC transporter ATP-binding protein UgpC [Bifidobacteriaceae bacterium]|jgi:multiple sugar transport system ATP-binding protein|nr:sn-glycerol-3-phosphate ABC transporter ATP-binding protein UgpC [Bifidobacteriaceae bacterium]